MQARRAVAVGVVLLLAVGMGVSPRLLFGSDQQRAQELLENRCLACHRLEGPPRSRFQKEAPDLIGAGSKLKHEWVVGFLTGKEQPDYALTYRWDREERLKDKHIVVSQPDAEAIAEYLETNFADPQVKPGAIDMATFSKQEAAFGETIFKEHACIGCHRIREGGKVVGGPQSASFVEAGRRLKADWIYRFNSNPPDYVPHSGEFVGDVSALGLRYVTGFIATRGWENFPFYEPWKSKEFGQAGVERGRVIYKEYCAQCHGKTGQGDGPAAAGLEPKPAVHANIAFEKLPTEYLYNVIYYGGRGVGKSPTMPYWGLTIGQQGVADVIAYLRVTFKGAPEAAAASSGGPSGVCPQPRKTATAPEEFLKLANPLPATPQSVQAGKTLFLQTAKPLVCAQCHGERGDGQGLLGAGLVPPPRNFTCGQTLKDIPDGQLFWIIKNGSPGTGMMAFAGMPDDEVWQVIRYIRSLAR